MSSPDSDRPEIVCLCGSTRFADEMLVANRDLECTHLPRRGRLTLPA